MAFLIDALVMGRACRVGKLVRISPVSEQRLATIGSRKKKVMFNDSAHVPARNAPLGIATASLAAMPDFSALSALPDSTALSTSLSALHGADALIGALTEAASSTANLATLFNQAPAFVNVLHEAFPSQKALRGIFASQDVMHEAIASLGGNRALDQAFASMDAARDAAASIANSAAYFDQGTALQKPANVAKLADPHSLAIYVRKGTSDSERWLSFRIPEGMDQFELLEAGFAVDGNQAVVSISQTAVDGEGRTGYSYPVFEPKPSFETAGNLPEALRRAELVLASYLQGRGFTISFK